MQFDEFDKKVKEAADHHHPAYDEQAWTKMEKLLKKHLPQKEDDRRRFLFFLLLFLGLGGAGVIITKPWKGSKVITATENTIQEKSLVMPPSAPQQNKEKTGKDNAVDLNKDKVDNNKPEPDISSTNQPYKFEKANNTTKIKTSTDISLLEPKLEGKRPVGENNKKEEVAVRKNVSPDLKEPEDVTSKITNPVKNTNPLNDVAIDAKKQSDETLKKEPLPDIINKQASNEPVNIAEVKKDNQPTEQTKAKKIKQKSSKANSFFISLSTGPDVSFVTNGKLGTTKLLAGAGVGYTFRNRFTIRSGFYSGRKVYTALPGDYNPPANFYIYYPYLEKVDADCRIYEIPINLSYNFINSAKQSWFATVGSSSYLMKRETYNYTYKSYPWSPVSYRKRSYENVNKHYFSALALSGGYQRNISKHISFTVEPYIKLPLSGVGYGKVKLNSGGVLFSAIIKPFGSSKKPATKQ